jgi:hypothetical protein
MIETPLIRHSIREPWQTDTVIALGRNDGPDYALHDALLEAGCRKELTLALIKCPLLVTMTEAWINKKHSRNYYDTNVYWYCVESNYIKHDIQRFMAFSYPSTFKEMYISTYVVYRIPPGFTMELCATRKAIIQSWLEPHFINLIQSYQKSAHLPNIPDNMLG